MTWMNLEGIMLREISQTQKGKYYTWYHLHKESKIVKLIETKSGIMVARSWRKREMGEVLVKGYKVLADDELVLKTNFQHSTVKILYYILKNLPRGRSYVMCYCHTHTQRNKES